MSDCGSKDGYYKINKENKNSVVAIKSNSESVKNNNIKHNKNRDEDKKRVTVNSDSLEEAWGNHFDSEENSSRISNKNSNSNRILLLRQTFKGPYNK